jgi:Metallo-beta-lactamase superfamily
MPVWHLPTVTAWTSSSCCLYFLHAPVGHAYLWHDRDGLTLIDTGLPGSAPLIARAIREAGSQPADLRRVVLTHFHADHIGAAAEIADWGEVEVVAHRDDAPFTRARAAGPAPDLAGWERPVYDQVMSQLLPGPVVPPRIDRELDDGDTLSFGDGAVAAAAPGQPHRSSGWPPSTSRSPASATATDLPMTRSRTGNRRSPTSVTCRNTHPKTARSWLSRHSAANVRRFPLTPGHYRTRLAPVLPANWTGAGPYVAGRSLCVSTPERYAGVRRPSRSSHRRGP